ncbi:MAG: hypothetical protein P1U56_10055 [Saprospiraceae bacterium]|nr:hypothetical protein [Saprospiraceae bacterium]
MKTSNVLLFIALSGILLSSCMKEEMETVLEPCSCSTSIRASNGEIISIINTAEDAPITGKCSDLDFVIIDQETGEVTNKRCG